MITARHTGVRLIALALVLAVAGCGPSARDRALSTTLLAVNSARDGFIVWDRQHQNTIIDAATSAEDGEATLGAYRERRTGVMQAFEIAYRALAVGAINKKTPLPEIVERAAALATAIAALKQPEP